MGRRPGELKEINVFRGGRELAGAIFSSFWWSEGCLEAFWKVEAMELVIGGFKAGKWRLEGEGGTL